MEDWLLLGDIMHRLFEGVSKGALNDKNINDKVERMIASQGLSGKDAEDKLAIIIQQISSLQEKDIWQNIIMPRADSYTELPFILRDTEHVYSGRIDRVIRSGNRYNIYDYKTFPVKEKRLR